jgi:3'-phosphoadenosine 5'-phosphosulfate sulfotransferase (PAPS reductase)/FAD synthetase
MSDGNRVWPERTMSGAIEQWNPVEIYALYSGGDDSMASTHFAMTHGARKVLHINTGVGIARTRQIVRDNCAKFGWPLVEAHPPHLTYLEMCAKYGVPGPGAHAFAYIWLKERALDKVVRETKRKRMDRVMLVTGVRQTESARRMGHVQPIKQDGCSIWVAPCFDWTSEEVDDYLEDHNLPHSPVKEELGMSGECLCGAYGDREREMPLIRKLDPACADLIQRAEELARFNGKPCEWGRARRSRRKKAKFMPLCVGCLSGIERAATGRGEQRGRG